MSIDRRKLILSTAIGAFTIPLSQLLSAETLIERSYDYIIVGAGTAGCIVAARLAEQLPEASVLLIEAGGYAAKTEAMVWDPSLYILSLQSSLPGLEWGYTSEPQSELNGRSINLIRGKGIGGSSLRNGMVYVRGGEQGFDRWNESGATDWEFSRIRAHFEAVEERMNFITAKADPLTESIVAAAASLGLPYVPDYNAQREPFGIGPLRFAIRDQKRQTTYSGFLENRHLPNLTILAETRVQKIDWAGMRAQGISVISADRQPYRIAARQELILSAGAIASPQILMLSGIGDSTGLAKLGMKAGLHLPGVGENFQDDVIVSHLHLSSKILPPQEYGFMGLAGFTRSSTSSNEQTDIQFHFGSFDAERKVFGIIPMILLTESRGSVKLRSADPLDLPRIDPKYLSTDGDWKKILEALILARQLAAESSLRSWCEFEIAPGANLQAESELRSFIRDQAGTGLHYAGTCKMGEDETSVVDSSLRVHGLDNLRVADASIIPRTVSGNTAGATMMIAHRASDLIAASRTTRKNTYFQR